jgi:hypothetical protein
VKRKSELERLTEAVRQAEAKLDAAARLSDVKAAASRLQRARAELRAAEEAQPLSARRAPSREAPAADVS